jgi:hypothetical protein
MTITLNRPERLNSFNDVMHQQLSECLKQAERDDTIRCLLITGAGRGFAPGRILTTATSTRTARHRIWGCPWKPSTTRWYAAWPTAETGHCSGKRRSGGCGRNPGAGLRYGDCRAFSEFRYGLQ